MLRVYHGRAPIKVPWQPRPRLQSDRLTGVDVLAYERQAAADPQWSCCWFRYEEAVDDWLPISSIETSPMFRFASKDHINWRCHDVLRASR